MKFIYSSLSSSPPPPAQKNKFGSTTESPYSDPEFGSKVELKVEIHLFTISFLEIFMDGCVNSWMNDVGI
jgi:hypothetical protein